MQRRWKPMFRVGVFSQCRYDEISKPAVPRPSVPHLPVRRSWAKRVDRP